MLLDHDMIITYQTKTLINRDSYTLNLILT